MGDVSVVRVVVGLAVAIGMIFWFVTKTKIHVFLAMIMGSVVAGLIAGLAPTAVMSAIKSGFGGTLGSIGIIIGFGVMMVPSSKRAGLPREWRSRSSDSGKGREEIAMAITDSSYRYLCSVTRHSSFFRRCQSRSRNTGKSVITISCALGAAVGNPLIGSSNPRTFGGR